ncbi:LysR family substrate-binding domain-containing protein [Streptomyces sp. 900105755]
MSEGNSSHHGRGSPANPLHEPSLAAARTCATPQPCRADLASEVFAVERLTAALPQDHPLAGADQIGLEALRDHDFVLPNVTALPALAEQVHLACRQAGFTPRRRAVADDLSGLLSYVASGLCVSLLAEGLRDFGVPGIAFVPVRGSSPQLETTVFAVYRPDADAAVLRVLEVIRAQRRDPPRP